MCGFAGQIRLNGFQQSPQQRMPWLQAMGRQLSLRGPDDEQYYQDEYLSLVFRRLSIIDLEGGRQPIWNQDRSILSVVNGEIYNHQEIRSALADRYTFSSQSDSEVIVHLFEDRGSALMDQLNGMFAFVVWDTRRRRFLMARDRLGIKPLFYTMVGDSLIFASELKALLAHPECPKNIDWSDFERQSPEKAGLKTFVQGVKQLPGGQYLSAEAGKQFEVRQYWSIEDHFSSPEKNCGRQADQISEQYGELLVDSVHKRLMSDVPVGLFLSGGIDSVLLAAIAADAQPDLQCFTVVEDTTVDAGDVEWAQRTCNEFGLNYYPVSFDSRNLLEQLDFSLSSFEQLVWALDTPRFSIEWLLKKSLHQFAKTHHPDLKVILLGQGADEFAGGYSRSLGNELTSWEAYRSRMTVRHRHLRRMDYGVPAYMFNALADEYPREQDGKNYSLYHREMQQRTQTLQNYNLWHEDRTSSCNGIESRVPFLDHRLVELLAGIPEQLHENLFFDKKIVRDQLARSMPSYPRDKLKVRFYATGKDDSIVAMKLGIIRRIFPEFRQKYLEHENAIFSAEQLTPYYVSLVQSVKPDKQALEDFLTCMTISVFGRMCQDIDSMFPARMSGVRSPLQLSSD